MIPTLTITFIHPEDREKEIDQAVRGAETETEKIKKEEVAPRLHPQGHSDADDGSGTVRTRPEHSDGSGRELRERSEIGKLWIEGISILL
uniref:Uncharacterized protein n=1 Tax=Bursaphelenchus xylophilus TaxID=6326 RepID=A0A1I7RNS2_BURXY